MYLEKSVVVKEIFRKQSLTTLLISFEYNVNKWLAVTIYNEI